MYNYCLSVGSRSRHSHPASTALSSSLFGPFGFGLNLGFDEMFGAPNGGKILWYIYIVVCCEYLLRNSIQQTIVYREFCNDPRIFQDMIQHLKTRKKFKCIAGPEISQVYPQPLFSSLPNTFYLKKGLTNYFGILHDSVKPRYSKKYCNFLNNYFQNSSQKIKFLEHFFFNLKKYCHDHICLISSKVAYYSYEGVNTLLNNKNFKTFDF